MLGLRILGAIVVLVLAGCAERTPLRGLPLAEQRERGERAIVQSCGFPLDVESTITRHHRDTWATAHEYIEIASASMQPGDLARFFHAETLNACGARESTEAGGVRAAVGKLIRDYGADDEVLAQVERVVSPRAYCERVIGPNGDARYVRACASLGFLPPAGARN